MGDLVPEMTRQGAVGFTHRGAPAFALGIVRLGERGYNMERLYNAREGLTKKDDSLPDRLTKTPQDPNNPKTIVNLDEMLPRYYRIRGWSKDGTPTKRTLRKLGMGRPIF